MFILFVRLYFLLELMMCFAVIRSCLFSSGTHDVLRSYSCVYIFYWNSWCASQCTAWGSLFSLS